MALSDPNQPGDPVKVTDRRLFTADGERRTPEQALPEILEAEAGQIAGEGFTMSPTEESEQELASLVVWLSSIAFINLGGVENPVSGKLEVNLETARQMIDFLDILRVKTKGNLTPVEEKLFSRVFELKLLYSHKSGAA